MLSNLTQYLSASAQAISDCRLLDVEISKTIGLCVDSLKAGNKIIWFGNGGSASDALHLSTELVGKFSIDRDPLASLCLNTNVALLTAIANDYGYVNVFKRQIKALGNSGDICIGLSTSGESKSVIYAVREAKEMGLNTIVFTGNKPNSLWEFADVVLAVPTNTTSHVQECHITIGQYICGEIERDIFGKN